jgi:hypothetical protein
MGNKRFNLVAGPSSGNEGCHLPMRGIVYRWQTYNASHLSSMFWVSYAFGIRCASTG